MRACPLDAITPGERDCAFVVSCSDTLSRISLEVRIVRIT